ncbi:hypothetical protein DAEQUDRAFT_750287 [Daedalea quercina L-15889]|uniref:Protein kinase domain-containing protein n=1 Tax=Daedalea quercina L-15889 TaxID=1314783 RepID=A0A165RDG9_9APHY|nr:hypothetical protein DAEQUDRAFT_750287 [Daedalea quercina L-15889]
MFRDSTRCMYLPDARSSSQKHPVYVVVIPKPPAPAVIPPPPPDHDDEEDGTLAPVNDHKAQQDEDRYIVDGRYYAESCPLRAALPVELFHPVFAQFATEMADEQLQVPADVAKKTAKLMLHLSQIATKETQREDTRDDLSDILDCNIAQTANRNQASADHIIVYNRPSHPKDEIALAIVEQNAELGTGSDPSRLREACFCPSFIISVAGPWISISGAIMTTAPIVQRLTEYTWLGRGLAINDARIWRVARMLFALRRAINALRDWYTEMAVPANPSSRLFPLATSCTLPGGATLEFRYEKPLMGLDPSCATFLVRVVSSPDSEKYSVGRRMVVKFVEAYGRDAHELLARNGFAPELIYYGDVWPTQAVSGPWKTVVMEYVEGVTLAKMCVNGGAPPRPVYDAVRDALALLHGAGMVHGAVRSPNILVANGEGDMRARTRILDFDWAGKQGQVRYPLGLFAWNGWADGVADCALIEAAHDLHMLAALE